MAHSHLMNPETLGGFTCYVDTPASGASVYAECISVAGWLHMPECDPARCCVRGWVEGELIGETTLLFLRPDVCAAMNLPAATPTGFRFIGRLAGDRDLPRDVELTITASWSNAEGEHEVARVALRLLSAELSQKPYGERIFPEQRQLLHREHIYGSGPPVEEPGAETLQLLTQYLGTPGSVLDVGCGAGAYGPALIAAGHAWLGLEVNESCWEMLARRGLPHRKTPEAPGGFPCGDREFDSAICVEVLEHIAERDTFLGELARVIQTRALFSVPNIEVIPYFSALQVVPWHLLEADHKNFFTRASLKHLLQRHFARVEVFSYAEHPVRTPDGIPLHLHLFAIAEK